MNNLNHIPSLPQDPPGSVLVARIIAFIRYLRGNDFHVGIQEELDALKIAASGGLMSMQRLRWGLRALLCSSSDEWERFDELFDAYWRRPNRQAEVRASFSRKMERSQGAGGVGGNGAPAAEAEQAGEGEDSEAGEGGSKGGASAEESMLSQDFRLLDNESQMREMEQMVERLARRMCRNLLRRQRISLQGRRLHLRRTIRNSLRYGGMPLKLAYRQRRRELPRLILLLDVSRSMSLYSYLFLRFARGIVGAFSDADAFVYHTRLLHVTDALSERDTLRMKEKLALMSQGWSGGTRIGECLHRFNSDYGRLINSRTVVIIVSDGYDTGEPQELAQALALIQRRAKKLVWLNPLLGREGYQPVARGMQAALPHIDLFAPAHNLESLLALESYLMNL
jgi:uncharacterized protein with von Willebrand factor type A (vWA) domain